MLTKLQLFLLFSRGLSGFLADLTTQLLLLSPLIEPFPELRRVYLGRISANLSVIPAQGEASIRIIWVMHLGRRESVSCESQQTFHLPRHVEEHPTG
jgi:hypothetical protein